MGHLGFPTILGLTPHMNHLRSMDFHHPIFSVPQLNHEGHTPI